MRVLFTSQAEKTHMHGMVPLAWAMRARGHDVRFAGQPALGGAVARAGLPFVAVGADHRFGRAMRRAPQAGVPFVEMALTRPVDGRLREAFARVVTFWLRTVNEPMLGDLVALCRQWRPDLVVWEATTFAGPVAAEAAGVPHARFLWGLDLITRVRDRLAAHPDGGGGGDGAPEAAADPLTAWLADRSRRLGADPSEALVRGGATLATLPGSVRTGFTRAPREIGMRYVPYNGPARVPDWLRTAPAGPRVCLTLGTSALERFDRDHRLSLGAFLAELDRAGVEVVAALAADPPAGLGAPPPNTRLTSSVPMHALLEGCSAVVHHGGAGTCATALVNGVPQVIVPDLVPAAFQFDEAPLAERLAARGAGTVLGGDGATGRGTAEAALRAVGDPGIRCAADRLRCEAQGMPSPAEAAADLEAFAAGPPAGGPAEQ